MRAEVSRRGVVVSHPTRQYSHRTAEALDACGRLHTYLTGIPTRGQLGWAPKRLADRWSSYDPPKVATEKIKLLPIAPAMFTITRRLITPRSAKAVEHFAYDLFDSFCAAFV